MIALDKLYKERDLFERRYKLKGKKFNLDKIFALDEKRKRLGLETEAMRAECNKLCGSVAAMKESGKPLAKTLEKIEILDSQIAANNKILAKLYKKIDALLAKLHNLPENENDRHLQLTTAQKTSSISELEEFLQTIASVSHSKLVIDKHLKSMKNMLLTDLPQITRCKIGYEILTTQDDFDRVKTQILNHFAAHSEHLIEVACKKLYKSNAASYLVHLNRHSSVYLEVINDFKTRENKIKYHDKKTDMTKFAMQLNIIIKFRLK